MSVKMRAIFVFSLMMLHSSMTKAEPIDCLGFDFFCTTDNSYLPCLYDETRNVTETISERSESCPDGTFCDTANRSPCDAGVDCGGKEFFCPTTISYMRCELKPGGTYRTFSNDVQLCPEATYCDNVDGAAACDANEIPTEAPPTTESTTTTTTASPALGELAGYTCAGPGRYPHPTDCRCYIFCAVSGTTYVNSQRQCANDLVYHPDYDGCRADTTPCDNMDFKCEKTGRFADPLNPSKYVWCLKIGGVFHAIKYSCPVGKIYDGVNACVEPIVVGAIETLAAEDETFSVYSISRRSLSLQNSDEADEERYLESGEMVADRINLNSNEDASVYARGVKFTKL